MKRYGLFFLFIWISLLPTTKPSFRLLQFHSRSCNHWNAERARVQWVGLTTLERSQSRESSLLDGLLDATDEQEVQSFSLGRADLAGHRPTFGPTLLGGGLLPTRRAVDQERSLVLRC